VIMKASVELQLQQIREDGCEVQGVMTARDGQIVILYSAFDSYHTFARIVYDNGIATKRYQNDLAMYVQKKVNEHALKLAYIRILHDKINQGYGTLLMNHLLDRARKASIRYIEGHMQETENREHEARLRHFYHKFGFSVDEDRNLLWVNDLEQARLT